MKLDPTTLSFGKVARQDPPQTKTALISRGDGGPIKPEVSPVKTEGISAQVREIEAGEKYELEVTLTPPFKSDNIRENLNLQTGIPQAPTTTVSVYATLDPLVTADPKQVLVPKQRDAEWTTTVRLTWTDGSVHKVVGVTANDPDLKVEPDHADDHQVVVCVPAEWEITAGSRFITIETDDPNAPTVKVPLRKAVDKPPRPRRTTATAPAQAGRELDVDSGAKETTPPPSTE